MEKQKFVYVIFDKILLTDKDKLLVWQYASTFDAHKRSFVTSLYMPTPQPWSLG
jgi:hypothetical protein